MKRLLERDDLDGADCALADLLRAEKPFRADPFRKRRILVRLSRPAAPRRRWLVLRPLFAGMLVSGAAIGALGSAWLAPTAKPVVVTVAPSPPAAATVAVPRRHVVVAKGATTEPTSVASTVPAAIPAPTPRSVPLPRPIARTSTPYPPGEDPSSVVSAIVALRNEKDPQRATRLLNQYLAKNPSGSLSEDALALSIEAAARNRDPRVGGLARRYLERYPQGRYRAFAQQALREIGTTNQP